MTEPHVTQSTGRVYSGEKWEAKKAYARDHYYRIQRGKRFLRRYGLTEEEREGLISNGCNICGAPAEHIDHNHETGVLRGALCQNCNRGLGMFKDNVAVLEAAIRYLKGVQN